MTSTEPTRQDCLDNKVTHAEYYRAVAKTAGIGPPLFTPAFLDRVRKATAEGDEHLNSIPLQEWDNLSCRLPAAAAFKAHGDSTTLAGCVCLLKTVALDAIA